MMADDADQTILGVAEEIEQAIGRADQAKQPEPPADPTVAVALGAALPRPGDSQTVALPVGRIRPLLGGKGGAGGGDGPSDNPTVRWSAEGDTRSVRADHASPSAAARQGRRRAAGLRDLQEDQRERLGRVAAKPHMLSLRSLIWLVFGLFLVIVIGVAAGRQARQYRIKGLAEKARAEAELARRRGTLPALLAAAGRYDELLRAVPTDGEARAARAHLLAEAAYEFGDYGDGPEAQKQRGRDLYTEAESAVRLVQTETSADAQLAGCYLALSVGQGGHDGCAKLTDHPYLLAQAALLLGKGDEAVALLRQAVKGQPDRPLPRLRLSRLLSAVTTAAAEAEVELLEVLRQSPGHPGALIERAARGIAAGDRSAEVGRVLTQVIGRSDLGAKDLVRAELALAALSAGSREEVTRHLAAAQGRLDAQDVLLREELAQRLLLAGQLRAAEREARAVLARAPRRLGARLTLLGALLRMNLGGEVLELLPPLLEERSQQVTGLLIKAEALMQLDQTLDAQEVVRLAEKVAEADQVVRVRLLGARILLSLGDLAEAKAQLQPLLPQGEGGRGTAAEQAEAQLLLAQVLLAAQPPQRAEARALLEWLVQHAPGHADAHLALGQLLIASGQIEQGRAQLEKALSIEERPAARRELARLALMSHDVAQARRHYDVLLTEAEDGDLLLLAARAYRLGGDPAGALRLLGRVRHSGADLDEQVLIERGRALLLSGQAAEAVALLGKEARSGKRPTLSALLIRALIEQKEQSGQQAGRQGGQEARARALLGGLPEAWRKDPDVQLAEVRLLLAEGKLEPARLGAAALIERAGKLHLLGDEIELTSQAEKVLGLAEQGER